MRGLLCFLAFVALAVDRPKEMIFVGLWRSPLAILGDILFTPLPGVRLPLWDFLVVAIVVVGHLRPRGISGRARPVDAAVAAGLVGIVFAAAYGVLRGGSAYQVFFQVHALVEGLFFSLAALAVFRSDRDFRRLGLTLLVSALARAAGGLYVYVTIIKVRPTWPPPYLTSHDDTVLFVGAIVLLLSGLVVRSSRWAWPAAITGIPFLMVLVALNQRRVAWVALGAGILTMFVALRPGGVRRRLRLAGLLSLPLLALYVAVGEQQTSRIFAPVHALNTIWGDTADDSTLSRRIEDAGLVSTLAGNPLFGTGWGHEYKEIDTRYAPELIKRFPQYRYIPHNSMLGLAAFSGWLGFSLTWALVPVTLYLAVRTHRQAATPTEAQAGLFVAGLLPVYAVQAWADMGLQSLTAAVFLGSCVAVAGRLSVASGAWPGRRRAAPRRAAPGADPTLSPAA